MTPATAYKIFRESPHSRKPSRSTYLPFRPANLGPSRSRRLPCSLHHSSLWAPVFTAQARLFLFCMMMMTPNLFWERTILPCAKTFSWRARFNARLSRWGFRYDYLDRLLMVWGGCSSIKKKRDFEPSISDWQCKLIEILLAVVKRAVLERRGNPLLFFGFFLKNLFNC